MVKSRLPNEGGGSGTKFVASVKKHSNTLGVVGALIVLIIVYNVFFVA